VVVDLSASLDSAPPPARSGTSRGRHRAVAHLTRVAATGSARWWRPATTVRIPAGAPDVRPGLIRRVAPDPDPPRAPGDLAEPSAAAPPTAPARAGRGGLRLPRRPRLGTPAACAVRPATTYSPSVLDPRASSCRRSARGAADPRRPQREVETTRALPELRPRPRAPRPGGLGAAPVRGGAPGTAHRPDWIADVVRFAVTRKRQCRTPPARCRSAAAAGGFVMRPRGVSG